MKKVLLFLVIVAFSNVLFSQVSISCKGSMICRYNNSTEEYDMDCDTDDESSRFIFNEDETMFRHITPDITSTYYIQGDIEEWKDSDGAEFLYFEVVSDVGNKYSVALCFEESYITFYRENQFAIMYHIKTTVDSDSEQ